MLRMAALGALALVAAAALPPTSAPPPPSDAAVPGVGYTDVTRAAGLAAFHQVSGGAAKDYVFEATGSGLALWDYDGDGWLDVYLVNGATLAALRGQETAPAAALFKNRRDGTFTDVAAEAGVENRRWGQGACVGDVDNDGRTDLFVTNIGRSRLYRANGRGGFEDVAERAGVAVDKWATGCAFGDYDGDGWLDLFVAGYVALDLERLPPAPPAAAAARRPSAPGENDAPARGGMGAAYRAGAAYCEYRGQPVMCGPRGLKGAPDHLFRNNGNGTFTDVSARAGVADASGFYGLGVAFVDYDDDGKLDLIVANDSTPNHVYRNRGDGTFEDVGYASGAALNEAGQEQAHMGVAVGDYDNDGRADVHITNFADDYNVLYHNDGGGLFTDVSFSSGVGRPGIPYLGWGTMFLDYDHDGWLDLFVANGHVYPLVDRFEWNTSYRQRPLLFRNLKGRFTELGRSAGEGFVAPRSLRGAAAGDLDNDGDLDIVASGHDEAPLVLRNDGGARAGHWLQVRLLGDPARKTPRDAIGSVVYCTAGGLRRRGEVASGRSHGSQSDLRVHFGLGSATSVDKLEVRWANGESTTHEVTGVDRLIEIQQVPR
jgi:hypothetical protein